MKICTCLMCNNIFEDTNPQVSASEYPDNTATSGTLINGEDEEGFFKGCPICNTDAYLVDDDKRIIQP